MQIIIVDRRWAHARTFNVSSWSLALGSVAALLAILLTVAALYAVTFRVAADFRIPVLHDIVSFIMRDEVDRANQVARDNLSGMARKLGEMQAQLLRLDALGERVSKVAGIRPEEFNFKELPGRGGALPSQARLMTVDELQTEIATSAESIEQRADYMDVIESELLSNSVRNALLPQNTPVVEGFMGSGFGMRADPFTGHYAMHSGLDFAAPAGTAILAAAGGVVVNAELNSTYGNTIEIDHGNDLRTLYAHASRIDVKVGDLIKRGQKIGAVGTTGRSTGPHLHFEVHVKGVPQNPSKFLASVRPGSPLASLASREAKAAAAPARVAKSKVSLAASAQSRGADVAVKPGRAAPLVQPPSVISEVKHAHIEPAAVAETAPSVPPVSSQPATAPEPSTAAE